MASNKKRTKAENDAEYLRKFNAFNRGDKGTMTANENKYFSKEVNNELKRKNKSMQNTGNPGKAQSGDMRNLATKAKKMVSERPDPFKKDGVRTGRVDGSMRTSKTNKPTNLGDWIEGIGGFEVLKKKKSTKGKIAGVDKGAWN